jgi:formylmethanofuran dehydrogenase subunit E
VLSREAIFRQIEADRIELIQQHVQVDYDNALQTPISFQFRGVQHEVIELVGVFRDSPDDPSVLYLARTPQGVYALYPDLVQSESSPLWRGRWVLHFRVEEEPEENTMLVDIKLKQAVDFHGHLCPDLAIGYRASQHALDKLTLELLSGAGLRAIVENTTSAVDAVQQLTSCTLGNERLRIHDYGKHVYTFLHSQYEALRVALRPEAAPGDPELLALEARIVAGRATMMETARYQVLLDEQIKRLLNAPAETLFDTRTVAASWPEKPLSSELVVCDGCHEPVLRTHLALDNGRRLCRVCSDQPQGAEKRTGRA